MERASVESKVSKTSKESEEPARDREESQGIPPVHQILRLQHTVGNQSVQRAIQARPRLQGHSLVQRQPPSAPANGTASDPTAPAIWQVPPEFGGATVNNGADASAQLIDIKSQLEPLKGQFAGIPLVFNAIEKLLPETYGKEQAGPLTADMASRLSGVGLGAAGAYNVALKQFNEQLKQSLQFKDEQSKEIEEKAADILHETAFGKEADNEALEHAKEGFEKVHVFVEWAHYANHWVTTALTTAQSAKKFEEVAHVLESAGELAEKASVAIAALNSALAFYSAIKVSGDPGKSSTQKAVVQTKAGLSTIPVITAAAGTVAGLTATATGLGLLWTTMIPQIEQGLHMIEQLDERVAAFYKATSADEWWEEAQKQGGGQAPQIPSNVHFPGGQETLDFMWAVFKGSPPESAPPLVEKFFYDTRKKMNVGNEGDELDTEWHLFRANEVKNLIPWVQSHKDEVWGMIYGAMPHP